MRIVYLVNSKWPTIRGAERLLLSLCAHAKTQGHDVSVVAPKASAMHRACTDAGVRSLDAEFSPSPSKVWRLRSVLRELHPDIVHGMSIFPVALIRRLRLLPVDGSVGFFAYASIDPTSSLPVATAHFRGLLLRVRNAISRREAPRLDAIFAASETIRERLSVVGIRGHIIAIPGVVDVERLETDSQLPLPLPEGSPRIGYAGFLEELKGIGDLVTAFARVAVERPSASLLVAGDGPERERLMALAQGLGVGDRVHLLGHVDPVAPFLSALDVFVSASHSEALGRSIMEAMALGVPCVCTDVGGNSEVVRDEVSGLLVPPKDPPALARAIERLLGDTAFAARLADAGKSLVTGGEYSLAGTVQTVFSEYERAAARVRR